MKCSTICSNCEPDSDEYITADVLHDAEISKEMDPCTQTEDVDIDSTNSSTNDSPTSIVSMSPRSPKKLTLETCSIVYFAGYLANKCLEKYSCKDCVTSIINPNTDLNDTDQLLITFKTYDFVGPTLGLKAPSNLVIEITKLCLKVFQEWFNKIKSEHQILTQLKNKVHKRMNKTSPNLLNCISLTCRDHYNFIIELLLRTKIFKQCKWDSNEIKGKKHFQNTAKLRVLQNK